MGLLDEAIREHLELKRRGGADPSAVAREEQEALAPVFPDEDPGSGGNGGHLEEHATAEVAPAAVLPADGHAGGEARLADLSTVGQDTAELDMQAVMEEDPDAADPASPVGPITDGATRAAYPAGTAGEDLLEWEIPSGRGGEPAPEDLPGQERLSFE